MTAIWKNDGDGWSLLSPAGFPDEAALHRLIGDEPQLLPLAGSPQLTVLGSEVLLGNGYADLIAIEPSGRVVVIEVKLARNSEARRAVVAQVLTYAAFLRGMDPDRFEKEILQQHLQKSGHVSLADAVAEDIQGAAFDRAVFDSGLKASLADGRFRLVLVLDEAPQELVRLVGYLAVIAEKVIIDLVTVSSYDVGSSRVLVPQRVDPEYQPADSPRSFVQSTTASTVEGPAEFDEEIAKTDGELRVLLVALRDWAVALHAENVIRLQTYRGKSDLITLLPRLRPDNAGLVCVYFYPERKSLGLEMYRSAFERRCPEAIPVIEEILGEPMSAKPWVKEKLPLLYTRLLPALTDAYRTAARGRVSN